MAIAATATRGRIPRPGRTLLLAAVAGASCVILATGLATGRLSTTGVPAPAIGAFLLAVGWCFGSRRVDRTLAAVALYLGLLDGYLKLRTGSSTITLARDALVFAVVVGALLRAVRDRQRLFLPPLGGFVLAFITVVLVELANPSSRGLAAGLAGARQHLEFVPLFFLGYAFVRTEAQVQKALFVLVLCAAAGGVVSYIQSRLTPAQLAGWGAGYAERIEGTGIFTGAARVAFLGSPGSGSPMLAVRPFGLGSEIGSGALAASLAFPGLAALLITSKGRLRWVLAPISVGIGLAVATSGSRGAIVTVFVSLTAFGLVAAVSRNALKATLGIAVGIALIYVAFVQLGAQTETAQRAQSITPSRLASTFATERGHSVLLFGALATQHPLGVGLGTVGPAASSFEDATTVSARYNSETEWNFLVVEVGLAGVLVYMALILRLMWLSMSRIRGISNPSMRLYLAALAAPVFGLVVADFGGPTTATVPASPYLWLVSGVLAYWLVTWHRTNNTPRTRGDLPPAPMESGPCLE